MPRRCLTLLALLLLLLQQAQAQYTLPLQPRSGLLQPATQTEPSARRSRSVGPSTERLVLPPLPASAYTEALGRGQMARVYTFAIERPLELGAERLGQYLTDGAGNYSWQAVIRSTGARNVGLRLSHFALPRGGQLYVTAADGTRIGALTEQNNSPDSLLQLRPLEGASLTLRYDFPEGYTPRGEELPFRIAAVYHGFRTWHPEDDDFDTAHPGEPLYDLGGQRGIKGLLCAPNVLAYPQRWAQTRSTLQIIVGGTQASSAALINNTRSDGTPYVLTSAHCINSLYSVTDLAKVRARAATTVFFFGYQSPQRAGYIRPAEEQTLSGASLVAYNEDSDMCLLRIEGLPKASDGTSLPIPAAYNPYFAGWDRTEQPTLPYFTIHHPASSTKRYNEANDRSLSIEDYDISGAGGRAWWGKHWHVHSWATGTTAAGSSGSPLFDGSGFIIGALSGGGSTCDSPYDDYYWALARSWTLPAGSTDRLGGLEPHLDPTGSGATTCAGYDPLGTRFVQRLSLFYPDPATPDQQRLLPTDTYSPQRSILELGNVFSLPAEQRLRILGAYVVFRSTRQLAKTQLPQVALSLSQLERSGGIAQPISQFASTRMGAYVAYDTDKGSFQDLRRATRLDSIEDFFPNPSPEELSLPAGDYLLSLRSASGDSLGLPLLSYSGERSETDWTAWIKGFDGRWQRNLSLPNGAYWIDLLVETAQPIRLGRSSTQAEEPTRCYAYGQQLFLEGDFTRYTSVELRVYSLLGELIQRDERPFMSRRQSYPVQLPQGNYLAVFTLHHSSGSQERLSLYFTQP